MPSFTVTKESRPSAPVVPPATIRFKVEVSHSALEAEIWPSTLVGEEDDINAAQVLHRLGEDYSLDTLDGVISFLYDQNWWPETMSVTVTIEDIEEEKK